MQDDQLDIDYKGSVVASLDQIEPNPEATVAIRD